VEDPVVVPVIRVVDPVLPDVASSVLEPGVGGTHLREVPDAPEECRLLRPPGPRDALDGDEVRDVAARDLGDAAPSNRRHDVIVRSGPAAARLSLDLSDPRGASPPWPFARGDRPRPKWPTTRMRGRSPLTRPTAPRRPRVIGEIQAKTARALRLARVSLNRGWTGERGRPMRFVTALWSRRLRGHSADVHRLDRVRRAALTRQVLVGGSVGAEEQNARRICCSAPMPRGRGRRRAARAKT
jgi:hypothetical protein